MANTGDRVLYDSYGFDDYRQILYLCFTGVTDELDLSEDGNQPLASEARELAEAEYGAWVQRDTARRVAACLREAQQVFDLTFLKFLIESEGGTIPGAPDGPSLSDEDGAA